MTANILVSDPIPDVGIQMLRRGGLRVDVMPGLPAERLKSVLAEYDGLVVRSATKVTADVIAAAPRLRLIGRAGIGVDNIDLGAATRRGIVVMNTPGGSAITVAELTFALVLSMARHVAAATASLKAGRWDKKQYQGRELAGKTMGVIGLGSIGSMVVDRALAFGMSAVAADPFITREAAARLGAELVDIEDVLLRADVLSLHVPLTENTRHLINADALAKMKRGSYLVSCARGGIVDELALADALRSGHLAGAALDVFEKEPPPPDHPLFALDTFTCTPHLGASTREAQESVAVQLAEQVSAFFQDGSIRNAVNGPSVSREVLNALGPWLTLATRLGEMAGQLAPAEPTEVVIELTGEITQHDLAPLTGHALVGLLRHASAFEVNTVNAPALAEERGLVVRQVTTPSYTDYISTIAIRVAGPSAGITVVGSVFGKRDCRIVRIDDFEIDAVPEGHLLLIRNEDVPRIVGQIGTILGEADINIGRIHLSRGPTRGYACSLINIDSAAPLPVLTALRDVKHITSVTPINLV